MKIADEKMIFIVDISIYQLGALHIVRSNTQDSLVIHKNMLMVLHTFKNIFILTKSMRILTYHY